MNVQARGWTVYRQFDMWEPDDDEVAGFMKIVMNPAKQPVFAHGKLGANRAGVMVAVYRILEQGWTRDDAIAEMTDGGYGFDFLWTVHIDYLRDLDVDGLKRKYK